MQKALEMIKGKKTYIVATVAAALAFANVMGWPVPDFVFELLAAAGLATIRSAIPARKE
jgi:hypothetical protein